MKRPILYTVGLSSERLGADEKQLSLFEREEFTRIVCLPMAEIHGSLFLRTLDQVRPAAIVDLRQYPFFDLIGLDRSAALDAIHRTSSNYFRMPMDLRPPRDQLERWRLRESILQTLSQIREMFRSDSKRLMSLTNNLAEAQVFAQSAKSVEAAILSPMQVEVVI